MFLKRTALGFALFTALVTPNHAFAQDLPPAVQAIIDSMAAQFDAKPTYKNITSDDTSATIEGLEIMVPVAEGGGDAMKVTIEKVEFDEISEEAEGLYEIGSSEWTNTTMVFGDPAAQGFSVSIPEMSAESTFVMVLGDAPTAAEKFRASLSIAKKAQSGAITVMAGGQTVMADGFETAWDGDPATGSGKTSGAVKNVVIPESLMAMADPTGTLKGLGYSSISFDLGGSGDIKNDGTSFGFSIDGYYDAKDMAKLMVGMGAAGVPVDLLEEMKKKPKPDEARMLSMAQGISFDRFSLRFEDQSITAKLLPMLAAMQGMDEAAMKANAGAMVQIGMSQLQMPELTAQVAAAVNSFLADPKSITVSLKPAAPVTVGQLMTLNPADPAAAVKMLGVTVTAND